MIKTKFVFAVSLVAMLAVGSAWANAPGKDGSVGAAHTVYTDQSPTSTEGEGGTAIAGVTYVNRAVNKAGASATAAEAHAAAAGASALAAAESAAQAASSANKANTALAGKQDKLGFTPEDVANRLATIPADSEGQERLTNANYPSAKAVISYVDDALGTIQNGLGTQFDTALSQKVNIEQGSANANKAVITDASGNVKTGTITSGMIADKTIVNADISDDAEIAQSKISGLTAALSGKQATIADLTTIRSGAAAGATALQKADIDTGANNGTIKVGDKNVAVKGLGSAAYTESSAYATSEQGTKADNAVAKTDIGVGANFTIPDECKAENAVCSLVVRKGVAGWEKVTY